MKICSHCSREKSEDCFSFRKNGLPHRKATCKECHSADIRARYSLDPSKSLQRAKDVRKDPDVRRRINSRRNETRKQNPALTLWRLAKLRAIQKSLPFDIEVADIVIDERCPVLGIEMRWGQARRQLDVSPTVDRVVPRLGYVKGNVRVISWRANRIKSDATASELEAVVNYIKSHAWAALGVAVTFDETVKA